MLQNFQNIVMFDYQVFVAFPSFDYYTAKTQFSPTPKMSFLEPSCVVKVSSS
jgi:hypothetical protein